METVCITGASAGIGEATARRFAALGHKLVLVARREERLLALQKELGGEIVLLDVSDAASVQKATERFSGVTVLVNNAGLAMGLDPAQRAQLPDWQQMIATNINGVLHMTHAILPRMVAQKRGHIVNLGSVAGSYPYANGNVYGASKAFLRQFTLNLKADLLGTPVRVTSIEPGMVETEFSQVRFRGDESKAKAVYQGMQPLCADDIADTIVWAATRPAHVNINFLELMPVCQSFGGFTINRNLKNMG